MCFLRMRRRLSLAALLPFQQLVSILVVVQQMQNDYNRIVLNLDAQLLVLLTLQAWALMGTKRKMTTQNRWNPHTCCSQATCTCMSLEKIIVFFLHDRPRQSLKQRKKASCHLRWPVKCHTYCQTNEAAVIGVKVSNSTFVKQRAQRCAVMSLRRAT